MENRTSPLPPEDSFCEREIEKDCIAFRKLHLQYTPLLLTSC